MSVDSRSKPVRVGVSLPQQHCTVDQLRHAWREADQAGFDSLWLWDHFFPLSGDPDGAHFEAWSLLAAMACDTTAVRIGTMVSCYGYRNPDLLADMARTVDHLSGGRMVLGIGAGGRGERDYREYGYHLGEARDRVSEFRRALPRIEARLKRLNPPPVGPMPLLIAGFGEQVMLRVVAEHADMWNVAGPPEAAAHKNRVLDEWCRRVGRDPGEISRTVVLFPDEMTRWREYVEAGFDHLIPTVLAPFDLDPAKRLLEAVQADAVNPGRG
jgi:probable F420-dependent oxidoreductase